MLCFFLKDSQKKTVHKNAIVFFLKNSYLSCDYVDGCGEYWDSKSPEDSSKVLLCWLTLHQVEASEVGNQGSDWHLRQGRKL